MTIENMGVRSGRMYGESGIVKNEWDHGWAAVLDAILRAIDEDTDSIDVAKQSPGGVMLVHNEIAASVTLANCNEINCKGFNSIRIAVTLSAAKSWTFAVYGALASGGNFGVLSANYAGTMTAMSITQATADARIYTFTGITDFIKIVPTESEDGATATVVVQPYNS